MGMYDSMNSSVPTAFSDTEARIIEAAIGVFVRYGAKKTSMADIAEAAGVSRQTVYAAFGDKDGIIVACIRQISDESLATIRARLAGCAALSEQLGVYFEETVVKSFEMLLEAGDPEDLISGHNKAGKAAIKEAHSRQVALVAELLEPYANAIVSTGQTTDQLAKFVVTVAMALKYGPEDRGELDQLLRTLRSSVIALAESK